MWEERIVWVSERVAETADFRLFKKDFPNFKEILCAGDISTIYVTLNNVHDWMYSRECEVAYPMEGEDFPLEDWFMGGLNRVWQLIEDFLSSSLTDEQKEMHMTHEFEQLLYIVSKNSMDPVLQLLKDSDLSFEEAQQIAKVALKEPKKAFIV